MSTTDSSGHGPTQGARATSNLPLYLILAVCVAPFVASVALYLFWQPARFVNYGELVQPLPLEGMALPQIAGEPFRFSELRGSWVLLAVDAGTCDAYCQRKLYLMRQVRLTQGKEQARIERVWLVADGTQPQAGLLQEYAGTHAVRLADRAILGQLPVQETVSDHIYIVDPLGNLMMRFPRDPDPNRMKKDLSRLLRASSGWVQTGE